MSITVTRLVYTFHIFLNILGVNAMNNDDNLIGYIAEDVYAHPPKAYYVKVNLEASKSNIKKNPAICRV